MGVIRSRGKPPWRHLLYSNLGEFLGTPQAEKTFIPQARASRNLGRLRQEARKQCLPFGLEAQATVITGVAGVGPLKNVYIPLT